MDFVPSYISDISVCDLHAENHIHTLRALGGYFDYM